VTFVSCMPTAYVQCRTTVTFVLYAAVQCHVVVVGTKITLWNMSVIQVLLSACFLFSRNYMYALSLSLSLRFNGHFPGESGLAGVC